MNDPNASGPVTIESTQQEASAKIRGIEAARLIANPDKVHPTMFVRASDPLIPVTLVTGVKVGEHPVEVEANDIFIARRIRDGSLTVLGAEDVKTFKASLEMPPPQAKSLNLMGEQSGAEHGKAQRSPAAAASERTTDEDNRASRPSTKP